MLTIKKLKEISNETINELLSDYEISNFTDVSSMYDEFINNIKEKLPVYIDIEKTRNRNSLHLLFYFNLLKDDTYQEEIKKYPDVYKKCCANPTTYFRRYFFSIFIQLANNKKHHNIVSRSHEIIYLCRIFHTSEIPIKYDTLPIFEDTDLEELYLILLDRKYNSFLDKTIYHQKDIKYFFGIQSDDGECIDSSILVSSKANIQYLIDNLIDWFREQEHQHASGNGKISLFTPYESYEESFSY